jgi:protocatechuate 3,4-dioxygenase beta subunit
MRTLTGIIASLLAIPLGAQDGVSVEGVVTNPLTRTGVAGVKVTLIGALPKAGPHEATTGDSGDYHLSGIAPGEYGLRFSKAGYFLPDAADTNVFSQGSRIKVGTEPIRLSHQMIPLGALAGRVIAPDGKPAAHVKVEAVAVIEPTTATTDDDGRFAFDNLKPGTYKLVARPPAAAKNARADAVRVETVPTYYPSVTDQAEAQPIEVRGELEQSGFEIRLQSVQVYRVRGSVVDDAGQPIKEAEVRLINAARGSAFGGSLMLPPYRFLMFGSAGPWDNESSVTTGADGKFEFPAVRSGDWRLMAEWIFTDPISKDEAWWDGHASVLVARHDSDDVKIRISAPPPRGAIVDWGGLSPLSQGAVPLLKLTGVDAPSHAVLVLSPRNASPSFLGLDAAGRYRVVPLPTMQDGYNVASVWLGEREITGQQIELNASSPPIRVVMNGKSGSIRGTLEHATKATVVVAPANAGDLDVVIAVDCAADGSFQIPGMPPGAYSIAAYDRVNDRIGSRISVATMLAPASRVRVEEGATATIQLSVNRWPD